MINLMTAVPVTGTGVLRGSRCSLRGFSLRNTGAGAATYRVYDNASAASGTVLVSLNLAAGAPACLSIPGGVVAAQGLYFENGGSVEGSVWVAE